MRRVFDLQGMLRGLPRASPAPRPGNAATGAASSVADMASRRRSGRRPRCRRRSRASARSPSRWRSWNSSSTTVPTPGERRVAQQAPREHAFGEEAQARAPGTRHLRSAPGSRRSAPPAHRAPPPRIARPAGRPADAVRAPAPRDRPGPEAPAGHGWSCRRPGALPARGFAHAGNAAGSREPGGRWAAARNFILAQVRCAAGCQPTSHRRIRLNLMHTVSVGRSGRGRHCSPRPAR